MRVVEAIRRGLFGPEDAPPVPDGPQPFTLTAGQFSTYVGWADKSIGLPENLGAISNEPMDGFPLLAWLQNLPDPTSIHFLGDCVEQLTGVVINVDGETMFTGTPSYNAELGRTIWNCASETLVMVDGQSYGVTFS